ncbi:CDP-alcohol phosphatidyltransferase family protein [Sphingomonas sp. PAMC 26621]|uniref:CDP-alcohol phosphatidyltransferase family protein n=1 Tax=Sphingomonas sp. PAMC 26621 TaxID=1112213 RepID=UPI000289C5C6|nr:CDP-alcohol phosphatidyltransferase family protein [Sphingomonas sp. PAMC 26621]
MTAPTPDRSRDRRIEDPTNLWIIHPAAHLLLPWFIARGISANAVSLSGLAVGGLAALAYAHWQSWAFVMLGLLLSIAWLVADGLDGMVARATGTSSPLGRVLDGLCDHGVFTLIYVVLACSIGTAAVWALTLAAGAAHAVQSNLYESERARFHRRCMGVAVATRPTPSAIRSSGSTITSQVRWNALPVASMRCSAHSRLRQSWRLDTARQRSDRCA